MEVKKFMKVIQFKEVMQLMKFKQFMEVIKLINKSNHK